MTGKIQTNQFSPIVQAIALAEAGTTGEIRVHLSRRFFEKDAYARAQRLFKRFGMSRTAQRNAVLLYVNLRRRKFAIIGDEGIHKNVGQEFWEKLARDLATHLRSTHPERAIALGVEEIGRVLKRFFPDDLSGGGTDELPNLVTED